jgi:hypothetical protein
MKTATPTLSGFVASGFSRKAVAVAIHGSPYAAFRLKAEATVEKLSSD